MNGKRLYLAIREGLSAGATLVCASAQRQAAVRAAWAEEQRDAGRALWQTPRILTFTQLAEQVLQESWAQAQLPDQLLPPGAEWAALRDWRREAGGTAEARALLHAVRTLSDWRIPRSAPVLGGSPEGDLLLAALEHLDALGARRHRRPLRDWLAELAAPPVRLLAAGVSELPRASREALQRWDARPVAPDDAEAPVELVTADDDDHELDLIAAWCRQQLERDPARRLLVVDAKLRQRRGLYDRLLTQTLSPSEWLQRLPRPQSHMIAIEGGRPLAEFPIISHAVLTLRLLVGRLGFHELVQWLRLPFLDGSDRLASAAVEALLRQGHQLEFTAAELAAFLERGEPIAAAAAVAARLRAAGATLAGGQRTPAEWSPRVLQSLRQMGWFGSRPLNSDEQQTVARWQVLLDEYAALGSWLPRATAAEAVSTLADLASERNFDPASVDAPVTLTDSHEDPVVRYDAIWVAGLDAAQWPAPARPDVFIPLAMQVAAGIPWASALGQTQAAQRSFAAWRRSADSLICSWARFEGDAHRSPSPLLAKVEARAAATPARLLTLPAQLRQLPLESLGDTQGLRVDTSQVVPGGVTPLTLQAECGFHAYAEVRMAAAKLEAPAPGLDPRERGMLLHKALELVWIKLKDHFHLASSDERLRKPLIGDSVAAAVVSVFRGRVPEELAPAVERERHRLELLIEALLREEMSRPSFEVVALETRREVSIAGGRFELRIDRIDSIEGGGFAILDYKSGDASAPRWQHDPVRDPQLLAYCLAEAGRNVQALANVALTGGRARFRGKASRSRLLPGVRGMDASKVPAEEIEQAWHAELERWLLSLAHVATDYISGHAPVQPATDVCRHCHLTILCRRVELQAAELEGADAHD